MIALRGTGQEEIARAVLLSMVANVNTEIATEAARWTAMDVQLEATLQKGVYLPITVEPIALANFHLGHVPSLIEAPVDAYPNLSVMSDGSGRQADAELDQDFSRTVDLFIEVMVKAGPYGQDDHEGLAEDLCNRRIQRTVNAVVNILAEDRTLSGLLPSVPDLPRVNISDVFVRREEKSRGPRWFWQGARIEWTLSKPEGGF